MTNILLIGNSFFRRNSKDNCVNKILNQFGFTNVYLAINEGKGIVSFDTDSKCWERIENALTARQYQYIFVNGSCGGSKSSWNKHAVSLIRKIRRYQPNSAIYLVATAHPKISGSWSVIKSNYDAAGKAANCGVLYVGKYYSAINKKYPKLRLTDTDKNHPAYISYYLMACAMYSKINNKKAPYLLGDYKKAFPNPSKLKKYIADLVWNDYKPAVPKPTLKLGKRGTKVKQLQRCLNVTIGAGLKIDGVMGKKTCDALRQFQNKNGLKPDAIYGKKSYTKMKSLI